MNSIIIPTAMSNIGQKIIQNARLLAHESKHTKLAYHALAGNFCYQRNGQSFNINTRYNQFYRYRFVSFNARHLHYSSVLFDERDSSKVEQNVKAIREEVRRKESEAKGSLKPNVLTVPPKRSLGKRIWDEIVHYYHGFRLLFIDIGIASRLVYKVLNGSNLSRREYKQLVRTSSDVFRLVPFSVFVIVPFMELLLPVFLKFFPNMLPSTFQTASSQQEKMKQQFKLKLDMAKFLQSTLDELSLQSQGETHSHNAKEFKEFFDNIRDSGKQASNEDILKFSKLFEDEITLDSLSRPQLSALCRLLELQPIGTNNVLRFQLRMKLRTLKADDQMINKEGIDILTVPELQQACRARGMRAIGMSEERLRSQLQQWLELSLNEKIPPSLLLMSRVLYLPEHIPAVDQLKATLQALPQEAATETRYKIGETEGKIDNRTKIELIKQEEAAIKRENEEEQKIKAEALALAAIKETLEASKAEVLPPTPEIVDKAIDISQKQADKPSVLSKEDIVRIEDAIENIAKEKKIPILEKEELADIKEELEDYKEDLTEFKEISEQTADAKMLKESKAAKRLRNKMDKMISKMDHVISGLATQKEQLETKIDQLQKEGKEDEKAKSEVVEINDLVEAVKRIQTTSNESKLQQLVEVFDSLDVDHDGKIELDHVVKVIEIIGRENVELTPTQVKEIITLLLQEEKLTGKSKEKS